MRGLILKRLKKYGSGLAVIVSSALFALIHGNILQSVSAFTVGIALGFIFVRTNSLPLCVAMHCTQNAFALTLTRLQQQNNKTAVMAIILFAIVFVIIAAAVILLSDKQIISLPKRYDGPSLFKRLGQLFTVPFAYVCAVMFAFACKVLY
jgi:membrane protease YdiL (CAAX protease family)